MKNKTLRKIRNKMVLPLWYIGFAIFFVAGCLFWVFSDFSFKESILKATETLRDDDWRRK